MDNYNDIINYIDGLMSNILHPLSSDDIRQNMLILAEICNNENELEDCVNLFYKTFK